MKASDIQHLLNKPVMIITSGFKSVLEEQLEQNLPAGIVTKVEEGIIEVSEPRSEESYLTVNIDRIQRVVKGDPIKKKGKVVTEVYKIYLA